MDAIGYFAEGARRGATKRSIGSQNRAFLDFCTREGYEVAATFLDTAAHDERPGFEQLLAFLARDDRGFTLVAIDSLTALGKDLGHAALRLLAIENHGVHVLTTDGGGPALNQLVHTWADRGDGTPVSEKVRAAMRRKAVRGEVLGRPPYGYRVGARRRLELVPDEAVVVRYIFRLYLQESMGIRKIAGQLNDENVPTRRGGRWSMVTVRDLLRNRAYLGNYSRFGTTVTGSHPALVSHEDFRRVQERLQSRYPGARQRRVVPFLLSGLVFCARCGNKMIGVSRRQKWTTRAGEARSASYRYYQCESRTNQSACGYNTQRAAELEERLRERLSDTATGPLSVRRAGNADSYMLDMLGQVDRIESRMKRNRRQLEEVVADAAHGHITLERVRTLGAGLVDEHQSLQRELEGARARLVAQQSAAEREEHLASLRARIADEWETLEFDELQAGLREIIDRIDVDGPNLRITLRA
ncbi:recombinase family protein [bacterium]|jgi:DNA invertase Pin-like site-specific DNA recombinase|nr:recombinase family protein [bacterium]